MFRKAIMLCLAVFLVGMSIGGYAKEKKSAVDLLAYRDEVNGFTISYPQDWEQMPRQYWEGTKVLIAFNSPYPHKLSLIVVRTRAYSPLSLEDYYEQEKKMEKDKALAMFGKFSIISEEEFTVDNMPAKGLTFSSLTPGGRSAKYMRVFIRKGQTIWGIGLAGEPDSFDEFRSTFDTMISSFSLR